MSSPVAITPVRRSRRWHVRCALDRRRARLFVEIPFEVNHAGPSDSSATRAAGSAGAADARGHDPDHARERLAPTEDEPVRTDADAARPQSARPDNPADYRVEDEPIPTGGAVDFRYQFELMRDRVEREEDRSKSLDAKIASVIAGIVASIGFSLRLNAAAVTYLAAMLYLIPLITLFQAFRTKHLREAPTAESIVRFFPSYPVTTLKAGCEAMTSAFSSR